MMIIIAVVDAMNTIMLARLDPKYQDCVLERCQTSTIPQGLKDYLKENYECGE